MTATQVTDKDGFTLDVLEVKGRLYPRFPIEALEEAFQFKARSDDILLCTAPKAGAHWTNEILRFLIAGTTDLPVEATCKGMLEENTSSDLETLPTPRLVNTHLFFEDISPAVFEHKTKIIHITRDPRDSAISYCKHTQALRSFYNYDGEWSGYFHLFLEGKKDYGSWFEYTKGWEKGMKENPNHPFLVLSYEDMKRDPLSQIRRVAEFIQVQHTESFLNEVTHKTEFKVMKKSREGVGEYSGIYRKGQVGDWKNAFTTEQQELFDDVFEKEMVGTNAYKLYSRYSQP